MQARRFVFFLLFFFCLVVYYLLLSLFYLQIKQKQKKKMFNKLFFFYYYSNLYHIPTPKIVANYTLFISTWQNENCTNDNGLLPNNKIKLARLIQMSIYL